MTAAAPDHGVLAGAARRHRRARRASGLRRVRGAAALLRLLRAAGPARRARSRPATRTAVARVWSTDNEPDGVLRKACGNRREAVCPPCAERYRQDAFQLIAAGLRGGKGVPGHGRRAPAVFLTLTAPSFGVVHTRPLGPDGQPRRCRPRRDKPICPHGVPLSCRAIHAEDDARLGEPLCRECFDYARRGRSGTTRSASCGATRRSTCPRAMARQVGMTRPRSSARSAPPTSRSPSTSAAAWCTCTCSRASIARCPSTAPTRSIRPRGASTSSCSSARFREAVAGRQRARRRRARRRPRALGRQLDVRQLRPGTSAARSPATWPSTRPRAPSRPAGCCTASTPTTSTSVPRARARPHYMRTAFELDAIATTRHAAAQPCGRRRARRRDRLEPGRARDPRAPCDEHGRARPRPPARRQHAAPGAIARLHDAGPSATARRSRSSSTTELACTWPTSPRSARRAGLARATGAIRGSRACAHAFGYRGHCLTKSRRYSTTFKALREAREAYVHEQLLARSTDATQRAIAAARSNAHRGLRVRRRRTRNSR